MIRKISNKLPPVLQTDVQKQFFSATFDQLFSETEVEQAQGFIGRRDSETINPGVDNYLQEPDKLRAAYQLEPIAYAVNTELNDTNEMFYTDLLNYLKFRGGNTANHDRLFADEFYSFAPPIDVDKYLNYQNYIWLEDGAPIIYIQYVGSSGASGFDSLIENKIIGAESFNTSSDDFLRPRGLELSSGMRIRFEGSASYDRNFYIEGVGREIRLVEELTTLLPGSSITNVPWDNNIIAIGGSGYTMSLTSVDSIANAGRDYTAGDTLTIVSPDGEGVVTAATLTVDSITAASELSTINGQNETDFDGDPSEGSFSAGLDYSVNDTITLTDGTVITVNAVDGSGGVTQFTITQPSVTSFTTGTTLGQTQTRKNGGPIPGDGIGFGLTVDSNNETPINAISGVSINTTGDYLFAPPNPVTVTGGSGSDATFDVSIESALLTVTGGVFTVPATVRPLEIEETTGAIVTAEFVSRGNYTEFPDDPAMLSGGSGSGASVTFVEGGDTGELFDPSGLTQGFESNVNVDLSEPDYLTIERGSAEGSPWTRTNRWFNVDIINTTQSLGQILNATVVNGGLNYQIGDVLPVNGDGINGTITVTGVNNVGTITKVRVSGRGQGYSFASIDETGVGGTGNTILWDESGGLNPPHGSSWDSSFAWDQQIFAGSGTNAVIDIELASAISKSNKARRPILEFRRDLQLYEFGNQYIMEIELVGDTETLSDVQGQSSFILDGVELADGMRVIFLDPSEIPDFHPWDEDPAGPNSAWDTVPWEVEGSSGAVSRFIWQVTFSSGGAIDLIKVDPFTGQATSNARPVPVGGVVLATLGDNYAGDSFHQFRDPLTSNFTWREGQVKDDTNIAPRYELYDGNRINLGDPLEYPNSTFDGNEIFSYRELTAADLEDTGGTVSPDPILGFPLTLKGLQQISDIVFENNLETNRVTWGGDNTEIPGYYFFREWITDRFGEIVTELENGIDEPQSTYSTNWKTSERPERQRVIDRFLTATDDEDTFELSTNPLAEAGAILVAQGRRLNTDEFAFVPETRRITLFEKPTDTGFENADGIKQLFSFPGLSDPIEIFVDKVYQRRNIDYTVVEALQLENFTITNSGSGYQVNDLLTATGGSFTNPAQLRVVSINGNGGVTGLAISNRGVYAQLPANPFTLSGGNGSGAFISGDWIDATGGVFTVKFPGPIADGSLVEARQQQSGAPGQNSVVEIIYSTFGEITEDDRGFFQIPNGLENNPNNEEILEQSWNEFAPHMVSIIENQNTYLGTAFGSVNNYRDTQKDGSRGSFVLQSQAPLLKAMLVTSSKDLDIIESMRFNGKEYARYRNKFLKTANQMINQGFEPFSAGDSINTDRWVNEAIRRVIRSREFANAFQDTHMVAWNTVYEEETFTATGVDEFTTLSIFTDLEDKRNVMYVYLDGVIQVIDADYTISNTNPIQIQWTNIPMAGQSIVIRLFEDSAPAHIPATPAKLGLLPPHRPRIETDTSYRNNVDVIVGHDGSRTPIFNDFRDELLLELEARIYNGIISKFRIDYDNPLEEDTLKPGKFRETRWTELEWDRLLRPAFFKWVAAVKADYITNEFYDNADVWTWNYSTVEDIDGELLPGYWRGIFDKYYDTQTPHITPWEMLGFVHKPSWWESTSDTGDGFNGYGLGPWGSGHQLWQDLEAGRIRRGYRAGIDERYARPGLVANHVPVTTSGVLKSSPLECIDSSGSLNLPNTVNAQKNWQYGDLAPVEYAWRISEEYPFAITEAMFLARPGEFGEQFWDPEHIYNVPARPQQVVSNQDNLFKRIGNDVLYVHGETKDGITQINTGYQVWISSRMRSLNKDLGNDFGQLIRTLDVKLGHKMAGFTDKDTLSVFVEGISVSSQATNLLIPAENINVSLHTSPPVKEYVYGGVLIRAQPDGKYQVFGYNILEGEFNYIPRITTNDDRNVNIGGQPENFTNFEIDKTYNKGQIVRLNGVFYRALETHEASRFDQSRWQKLSQLPTTGGINVTHKARGEGLATLQYGDELNDVQEMFDFLIGYGDYLEQQGWQFDRVNENSGQVQDWLHSAKEFLLWVNSSWEANSVIMLSPSADRVHLTVQEGYPAGVERIVNGVYSILDKNGVVIDPINTVVQRDDRDINIVPTIEQQGIYCARVNTTETESVVTFDNTTDFNDVIYDPLLGTRLARLRFRGRRTTNWTGKLEAGGYIITENNLIPNFENLVNSIRFYHDTESTLDNPSIENTARHLIGFEERDYFEDLQVLDDAQFQFFQGAIRQKGTVQAIRKLERSNVVGESNADMEVLEEWAIKVNRYGNICGNQLVEFLIRANEVKVDPQLVELSYPASNTTGNTIFFTNDDVANDPTNTITITNHGFPDGDLQKFIIPTGETGSIAGLEDNTIYSVIVVDNNTIRLANPSSPDTALTLTKTGSSSDVYSLQTPVTGTVKNIQIVSNTGTEYGTVPSIIIENHPDDNQGANAEAIAILDDDSRLLRIDIVNGGHGYIYPPYVYIEDTILDSDEDRAIAVLEYDVTVDEPNDDIIVIDVDDNERWITRPEGIACHTHENLWPETVEKVSYNLPNSGNVSLSDITFSYVSTTGLDALADNPIKPSNKGETIHVAYSENQDFAVFALNSLDTLIEDLTIIEQVESDDPIYSQGRVILSQDLSGNVEDLALEYPTIEIDTNGAGEVSRISIINGGYGYFDEGSFVITDSTLSGGNNATVEFTSDSSNPGTMTLNMLVTTIDTQDTTNFDGVGENGTFNGGSGYNAGDDVTLSDGTTVQIDTVSGGAVTAFTLTGASTTPFLPLGTLTQASTTGAGSGFALVLGNANVELNAAIGSGYNAGQTGVAVATSDIPAPTQSGKYLSNVSGTGQGKIYAGNILYDYSFTGAEAATSVSIVDRGSGYSIGDEINANGGVFGVSSAVLEVVSVRTIVGQDESDYDGNNNNGEFLGGSGYGVGDSITLVDGSEVTVDAESGGEVTQFTISSSGGALETNLDILRQSTTDGAGTGFELQLGRANEEILEVSLISGGLYTDLPSNPVTVNGGTGSGATFNLTNFAPIYDITKGGSPIEDQTFEDNTPFFVLTNLRVPSVATRDLFTQEFLYSGARYVWIDNNGEGNWAVHNLTAPILSGQDETDYDGSWNSGTNGVFSEGTDYAVSDSITLIDGSIVTVNAVGGNGDVTEFTVSSGSTTNVQMSDTLSQVSTSGSGTGFSITVDYNNLDNSSVSYTVHRTQETLVDTEKFKNAFVYEESTKDTIVQLPVYDPFKGLIPGPADLNIRYRSKKDPARYNNSAVSSLLSETRLFSSEQVGQLWWDLSTCAYLYYEMGSNQYRRDNWGSLIEGSSVDIYEWTRSTSPPANYEGDGTPKSTTEYVEREEFDPILEEVRTAYYFWVKDKTIVPEGENRTLAAFEVARLLSNPSAQQFQWFSPISQSAYMFSGIDGVFTDSDNVFQINYRRTEDIENQHTEWDLGREGDPDYEIKDIHWNKMVDSLCGFTDLVDIGARSYENNIVSFQTNTGVASGSDVITTDSIHNFSSGDGIFYSQNGTVDIGLVDGQMYYVNRVSSTTLSLHNTYTDAIADANRADIASAGSEEHTLIQETSVLKNFSNAIPSSADSTKGYLIVPDPSLSETSKYGIKTRPLQGMFRDVFSARRIFVDKVNELMANINLRDENPNWNSSMTTNNLWAWVDWYEEGYGPENAIPTYQVSDTNDLQTVTGIEDGEIVKVTGPRPRLFEYDEDFDRFNLIARESSRLTLLSDIYTDKLNLPDAIELRELIGALRSNVFTINRSVYTNRVFFSLLNYVFTEQEDLDWAFKTTYVFLKQQGRDLAQDRVFQEDPFDSALEYITESKPYQSKIRDFRTERATEIDSLPGTAEEIERDFTVDMIYDRIRGGDLSIAEVRAAKREANADLSWRGYAEYDGGSTLMRLGAAGRFVAGQRDLISQISDVDSDIFEAYSTDPMTASITVDTNSLGQVSSVSIVSAGRGYYEGGTFTITDSTILGNDNAIISYTVDPNNRGSISSVSVTSAGNGYTVNQSNVPVGGDDLPTLTSAPITDDELAVVAEINTRITDEFADDFEGLFLRNTEFTGYPTLIDATINNAGAGYLVGDILQLDAGSGTPISNAQFRVEAAPGGAIAELRLINGGSYQQTPTIDPVNLLGGSGSGATVTNLVFESGSSVPFDSTPFDSIGLDSSVNDPNVDVLDGTSPELYRTIIGQTEVNFNGAGDNGTFVGGDGAGGTAYVVGDTIRLSDGTDVSVDAVNGNGDVTEFTITGGSTSSNPSGATLTQIDALSSTSGEDFSLTLGTNNQIVGTFFDIPAEETFSGDGNTREFTMSNTVPAMFLFAVVDGIELRRNIDYFFVGGRVVFLEAPTVGTNNIQLYTYIEAGDLINPQVSEGITEEMIPLDPRENLIVIADTVDVQINNGGTGYSVGDVLTLQGGTLKDGGAPMTIEVTSDTGGVIDSITVVDQGDYFFYPGDPVSVTGGTGNDDATFNITSVSFRIHEDTRQGVTYLRNADSSSTVLTSNVGKGNTVIPVASPVVLYTDAPTFDNPNFAWIGTERVEYRGVDTTNGALTGCRRGTLGTRAQEHESGSKVFDGGSDQEIPDAETFWVEPSNTNQYSGTTGQWRFAGESELGWSVIHFSDTSNNAFSSNVSADDVLVVTDTTVGYKYHVWEIIQTGELGIVTITSAGTGYEVGDTIDIDSVATGGSNVEAEVGAVDANGGIVYVRIIDRGSGYTDVGAVSITDSEITSTNGSGATMDVFFDTEGIVAALPHRILDVDGIVAEANGLEWQTDAPLAGGGLATSSGTAAGFLQAEPGNAV